MYCEHAPPRPSSDQIQTPIDAGAVAGITRAPGVDLEMECRCALRNAGRLARENRKHRSNRIYITSQHRRLRGTSRIASCTTSPLLEGEDRRFLLLSALQVQL